MLAEPLDEVVNVGGDGVHESKEALVPALRTIASLL